MKVCNQCKTPKLLTEFSKLKSSPDGLHRICKQCSSENSKKYYKTPKGIYLSIKLRTEYFKKHNVLKYKPLEITQKGFIEWYENEPKFCHYCKIPEDIIKKTTGPLMKRVHRLTIDCKDNELGYKKENLILACNRCNYLKSNIFTYEEMLFIGANFLMRKWKNEVS